MRSMWPIRTKVLVGLALLLLLVMILSGSGLHTTYAYRSLAKALSARVTELPVAAKLSRDVGDLRIALSELRGLRAHSFPNTGSGILPSQVRMMREQFRSGLGEVESTLSQYRQLLEHKLRDGSQMADNQREWETVGKIEDALVELHESNRDEDWMLESVKIEQLVRQLEHLQALAAELPSHLHRKMGGFADTVRIRYRTLIVGTGVAGVVAALILALYVKLFYQWVFRPLGILIAGSRKVASGRFSYRIHLETEDEMSELAGAMNDMTSRFRAVRDDLDHQVQERTKQVVRSEQLASVGFLAAGVAHEINNPLASIALCAESLESRISEVLAQGGPALGNDADDQHEVIGNYLRMIQSEAFRCKEITEKLLDFSRTGKVERQDTELGELVQGVIDMVGHLGKFRGRRIEFKASEPVTASVNAQEIKQVALNLLTNALDSVDVRGPGEEGIVRVELVRRGDWAELIFADNGCGMQPDVLEHIFEPFFTRRVSGGGTGLGLSITYRIVEEHGGEIHAQSLGPGRGATFRVCLPLGKTQEEKRHQYQAA